MNDNTRQHTIVIFTDRFPYCGESERTFLAPELDAAAGIFRRVIVVPTAMDKECAPLPALAPGVEVVTEWAPRMRGWRRLCRAASLIDPRTLALAKGDTTRSGLTFAAAARSMASWLHGWIRRRGLDLSATTFYTFWFDIAAAALALEKKRQPELRFYASAHGFDIFSRRGGSLRRLMLEHAERLFVASRSGAAHIAGEYPGFSDKIKTRALGCVKLFPEAMAAMHRRSDGRLTVLSVAAMTANKRVGLNARMMRGLAMAREDTAVHWIHVGDGPEMAEIRHWLTTTRLPANFTWELRGAMSNSEVQKIYATEPIDWFMLLSRREGGNAIAACEAIAYGVPLILSDTTGLADMADDDVAVMMPLDVEREEFVRGMAPYLDSEPRRRAMREAAFKLWRENYDATVLRRQLLSSIANG